MTVRLKSFDPAKYLDDEESIAAFLEDSAESGDARTLLSALAHVARARNMTQLAQASGMSRKGLYDALGPDGNPSLDTVMKVAGALGFRLSVVQQTSVAPQALDVRHSARQPARPMADAGQVTAAARKRTRAPAKAAKRDLVAA